jgi:hypothetical protein
MPVDCDDVAESNTAHCRIVSPFSFWQMSSSTPVRLLTIEELAPPMAGQFLSTKTNLFDKSRGEKALLLKPSHSFLFSYFRYKKEKRKKSAREPSGCFSRAARPRVRRLCEECPVSLFSSVYRKKKKKKKNKRLVCTFD